MRTVWLVGTVQPGEPACYIAYDGSGLTYQRVKAKHFDTPEAAEEEIDKLKLAALWEPVQHVVSG